MIRMLINRNSWFEHPWFVVCGVLLVTGVIAFAALGSVRSFVGSAVRMSLYGVTSAEEVDEATALADDVTSAIAAIHYFPQKSASRPNRPPVFVNAGSRLILSHPIVVSVYEIKDRAEQDRVIAAVEAIVRARKFKPVDLRFMDHENWIVHGNVGKRGPELQLRRLRITRSGVQEKGGERTITYHS